MLYKTEGSEVTEVQLSSHQNVVVLFQQSFITKQKPVGRLTIQACLTAGTMVFF